ncbi:hypothetical protein ACX3T3_05505 [Actinotignum schaalii]|uniref:hypothetical protein n=1 Tax=Actinotignum TaxID=1653174 RepID=UPI00237D9571|nr:hypothetical protein [Actinotignum sanguinis]MDE1552222.1 hypothetical protein [Actinotignum sanguinis]
MAVSVDTSEVRALAADLGQVDAVTALHVKPVVKKAAQNVKTQLRAEATRSRHFRIGRHISYDIRAAGYAAEIGPTKQGAGNLANIAYFGGARGGGGSIPDPRGALEAEAPNFIRELEKLTEHLI